MPMQPNGGNHARRTTADRRLPAIGGAVVSRLINGASNICNWAFGTVAALAPLSLIESSGIRVACLLMRSEEHTSELQSLMRISYADFCLQKKKQGHIKIQIIHEHHQ